MIRDTGIASKLWRTAVWAVVAVFVLNLLALIATVVIDSLSTRWLGTWLPAGFTAHWYADAWDEFGLTDVLVVTFEVVGAVVLISGALGVTAAYGPGAARLPGKAGRHAGVPCCRCSCRRSPTASRWRRCSTARASAARSKAWCWRTSCPPSPSWCW